MISKRKINVKSKRTLIILKEKLRACTFRNREALISCVKYERGGERDGGGEERGERKRGKRERKRVKRIQAD